MVLRHASSLKKTKEPESAQAGPNETRLAGAPTMPGNLLREPVSRDWPLGYLERLARCPEAPLHFWAEETERSARWRPLRPGTLAGLAD